jgi:hypothetical protein
MNVKKGKEKRVKRVNGETKRLSAGGENIPDYISGIIGDTGIH